MDSVQADLKIDAQIGHLFEAIYKQYGHDFRDYAEASLRRRVLRACERFGLGTIEDMQTKVIGDQGFFSTFLSELTVTFSEMFRNPEVYRVLATEVLPMLATYPSIRIWHAGCSTGEEVYSMAILLKEAGLLGRSTLYATDINPLALQKARAGVYASAEIAKSTANYRSAGNLGMLSDHYTADYGSVVMDRSLKASIVFAEHNLATDAVFSEVHLVLCRNVLIYFNKAMQERVLKLFSESLLFKGFLCLGSKESLQFSEYESVFTTVSGMARVFQKLGDG